ncbi:phosphoribosylanthranilate isomerase, partial [Streptococcus gordonii]|nr:phosphoribosylanthranilate isomerase [Streptococcus gordonii]
EVQPDYAGFIFAFGKRQITVETACNLSKVIKGSRLVGVFVNEQPARILSIAKQVSLDVIQLHGEETDEELRL